MKLFPSLAFLACNLVPTLLRGNAYSHSIVQGKKLVVCCWFLLRLLPIFRVLSAFPRRSVGTRQLTLTKLFALLSLLLVFTSLQSQENQAQAYKQLTRINNHTKEQNGKALYFQEQHQDQSKSYRIKTLKEGTLTTTTRLEYTAKGDLRFLFFEDLKKDFSVSIDADSGVYTIDYKENNKPSETFTIQNKQLVTLPELEFYVMQHFDTVLQNKSLDFTLFFPNMLATSTSLSYFDFEAKPTSQANGKLKIQVEPKSGFVRMLLPVDKKKLYLTFDIASKQAIDISFGKYSYRKL